MRSIITAAGLLIFGSVVCEAASFENQAAKIIAQQRYWCEGQVTISPKLFGNTANKTFHHVFCNNGSEVANYELELGRGGSYVIVREE